MTTRNVNTHDKHRADYVADGWQVADIERPATVCPHCGGTGEIDSGGASPWGEWLNDTCSACNGTGKPPQDVQP